MEHNTRKKFKKRASIVEKARVDCNEPENYIYLKVIIIVNYSWNCNYNHNEQLQIPHLKVRNDGSEAITTMWLPQSKHICRDLTTQIFLLKTNTDSHIKRELIFLLLRVESC